MKRLIGVMLLLPALALAQPPACAPEAPTTPAAAPVDPQKQLVEFEGRLGTLKEEVFRTKARLTALEKAVVSDALSGAGVRLVHRNEMGSSFTLEKVQYALDGTAVLEKEGGDLDQRPEFEIFSGPVVPGQHTVSALLVYRGHGFGVFSYLSGYVFTLRSSHTFQVDEGKQVRVTIVGYERGGATADLADRPDIRFEDALASPGSTTAPGG